MGGRSGILRIISLALVLAAGSVPGAFSTEADNSPAAYDFLDGSGTLGGPRILDIIEAPRGSDVLVNDGSRPGQHLGCTVQSEASVVSYKRFVYVAYNDGSQCIDNTGATEKPAALTGFARSTDRGKTFHDLGPLFSDSRKVWSLTGDPVLAIDTTGRSAGTIYLSSLATDREGRWILAVGKSTDQGRTFRWNPVPAGAVPDKEWIAIDNSGGPRDGTLYIVWFELGAPSGINALASTDGGRTWTRRRRIESGSVQGARVAVGPEGEVHVVWERNSQPVRPEIRWSRSLDGGRRYSRPSTVSRVRYIESGCDDATVQGIRVQEFPSIAVDTFGSSRRGSPTFNPARGTVYVVHAGRTRRGDASDVFLSRLEPGAQRWERMKRVNDDRTKNDQFFPEVVATGPGDIAISWIDRREDAAETPAPQSGNWLMRQWMATSFNGGRTIRRNVPFSDVLFPPPLTNPNPNTGIAPCYAGDYNGLYSPRRGRVLAAWGDFRDSLEVAGLESVLVPDQNVYFRASRLPGPRG